MIMGEEMVTSIAMNTESKSTDLVSNTANNEDTNNHTNSSSEDDEEEQHEIHDITTTDNGKTQGIIENNDTPDEDERLAQLDDDQLNEALQNALTKTNKNWLRKS